MERVAGVEAGSGGPGPLHIPVFVRHSDFSGPKATRQCSVAISRHRDERTSKRGSTRPGAAETLPFHAGRDSRDRVRAVLDSRVQTVSIWRPAAVFAKRAVHN